MKIKEVIVVEGEHDRRAVEQAVEADVEITGGYALTASLLERLRKLQTVRGLILFTDPDFTGEIIRRTCTRKITGVKHAYLPRQEAMNKNDIGIENAAPAAIRRALTLLHTETYQAEVTYTAEDLLQLGLIGRPDSARLRQSVGDRLGIGYANGKSFLKRLNRYAISAEQLAAAAAFALAAETAASSSCSGRRQ
ncbi:MAG: ribonuclease M5 [Negativicutes bacterium]|nr:ribonuclease M5 [Negativicutes bacterium]